MAICEKAYSRGNARYAQIISNNPLRLQKRGAEVSGMFEKGERDVSKKSQIP